MKLGWRDLLALLRPWFGVGQNGASPQRLTTRLRNATPNDLWRIKWFLWRNPSPNVKLRRTADYERSVANDMFYLLEVERTVRILGRHKIVCLGGVFPIIGEDGHDYELGNIYLIKQYRGFGIQRLMMLVGFGAATAIDREARFYAGARHGEGADTSRKNITSTGMVELVPDHRLLGKPCKTCDSEITSRLPPGSPSACCGVFFELPTHKQCEHIRDWLALPEVVELRRNRDLLSIEMKVHMSASDAMRAALEEWAWEHCD